MDSSHSLCSRGDRCSVPPGVVIVESDMIGPFRKQSAKRFQTCRYCRDTTPHGTDSRKRNDPPTGHRHPSTGNTPSTQRSLQPPSRPVSPSPARPPPSPLAPEQPIAAPEPAARPTRVRNPIARMDELPSPPPRPPRAPRPPATTRKCKGCREHKSLAEFIAIRGSRLTLKCASCREIQNERVRTHWANRTAHGNRDTPAAQPVDLFSPPPSTIPPPSQPSPLSTPSPASPRPSSDLEATYLKPSERTIVEEFGRELANDVHVGTCPDCNERWFGMTDGVPCGRCSTARRTGRAAGMWTASNHMDPGPDLQELCLQAGLPPPAVPTQVEEMLMSLLHVQMQMYKVHGGQTKYGGQTIIFPRDVATLATALPLLPTEIDVLVIRTNGRNELNEKFGARRPFRVRRQVVLDNLNALKHFHPSYRNLVIDTDRLNQLPLDGTVFDSLPAVSADDHDDSCEDDLAEGLPANVTSVDESLQQEEADLDEDDIPACLIPNVTDSRQEDQRIRAQLARVQNRLEGAAGLPPLIKPSLRPQPINEHEKGNLYLTQAFPFLFPSGSADINASRDISVTPTQYFRHLMKYKDGRFARHSRFRFYAWNTIMRRQARGGSTIYMKRYNRLKRFRAGDLRQFQLAEAKRIADSIRRQGANMRGTAPYWFKQSRDLNAMCKQIGPPSVFLTLSAADMQWPDLQQHMPQQPSGPESEHERQRRCRENLNDNPAIASYYFTERCERFLKTVVNKIWDVKDYWYRYEWQSRGSSHLHALLWIEEPRKAEGLDFDDTDSEDTSEDDSQDGSESNLQAEYTAFWARHMTAFNPGVDVPPAAVHPSARPISDLQYTNKELAELLNRVQRHTRCTPAYCLRRKKGTPRDAPVSCRFKYPKELSDECCLSSDEGRLQLIAKRNDHLLNEYNAVISTAWRANTDVTVMPDNSAVVAYITKYVNKAEKPSESFTQVLDHIANRLDPSTPFQVVVQKCLSKLLTERDWSAQEVCHLLLGPDLHRKSRSVVGLCVSEDRQRKLVSDDPETAQYEEVTEDLDMDDGDDGEVVECADWIDKYTKRPLALEELSLYLWYMKFSKGKTDDAPRRARKDKVVKIWPQPVRGDDRSAPAYQEWCRVKLLLHHPHRNPRTLDLLEDGYDWSDAYETCCLFCEHNTLDTLPRRKPRERRDEDEFEEPSQASSHDYDETALLAGVGPCAVDDEGDWQSWNELGQRDIDVAHDWMAVGEEWLPGGLMERSLFLETSKRQVALGFEQGERIDPASLNTEQRRLYDKVDRHWTASMEGRSPPQFLVNVDGTAGTGKSYLIDALSQLLDVEGRRPAVRRLAPTGVAAYNIRGETIHSALAIRGNLVPAQALAIPQATLQRLQADWQGVSYLIIDEKSMLGSFMLAIIDQRLQMIFPGTDKPFGGLSVLLFGDFGQLPPIKDSSMIWTKLDTILDGHPGDRNKCMLKNRGKKVFMMFNQSITLQQVMRQADTDQQTLDFKSTLGRLRTGQTVAMDHDLLSTRFWECVPTTERRMFDDAVLLAATNAVALRTNMTEITQALSPVVRCPARHTGPNAAKGSTEDAEGLPTMIHLMVGAKVMITKNLWTQAGLTNGTMAVIWEIGYASGSIPGVDLPAVIMVKCRQYRGPTDWHTPDGVPLVPIVPSKSTWGTGPVKPTRTQFPLRLAYAITIHKSQGMTLDRAKIDIGPYDFQAGLTFVACSRLKRLSGILFVQGFPMDRIIKLGGAEATTNQARREEARRDALHLIMDPFLGGVTDCGPGRVYLEEGDEEGEADRL